MHPVRGAAPSWNPAPSRAALEMTLRCDHNGRRTFQQCMVVHNLGARRAHAEDRLAENSRVLLESPDDATVEPEASARELGRPGAGVGAMAARGDLRAAP